MGRRVLLLGKGDPHGVVLGDLEDLQGFGRVPRGSFGSLELNKWHDGRSYEINEVKTP